MKKYFEDTKCREKAYDEAVALRTAVATSCLDNLRSDHDMRDMGVKTVTTMA